MKLDTKYIIELNLEEAIGLRILLGKESENSKKEKGLNREQSEAMSTLFGELPHKED